MKNVLLTSLVLSLALVVACSQPPPKPIESADETQDPTVEQGDGDGSPKEKEKEKGQKEEEKDPPDNGTNTGDKPDPTKPDPTKPVDPTPGGKDPIVTPTPTPKPEDTVKDPGTQGDGKFEKKKSDFSYGDSRTEKKNLAGKVTEFIMKSQDSKYYRGEDDYLSDGYTKSFERKGWIYVPPEYKGEELPFIFVGDGGWGQHQMFIPTVENLILAKKIPRMAVILLNSGGGDGPGSQRSFEYDSVNEKFAKFVNEEVLPYASKIASVKFTTNPEGRATAGGSSSGAMAFTMAWFRPDLFRRVITYSGTFVNRINIGSPKGAYDYHDHIIQKAEKKPLRVTLEVGSNDNNFKPDVTNNWITANDAMFEVLKAKGYHVRYHKVEGAGHIDSEVYKGTLADNLIWLWAGYPIK